MLSSQSLNNFKPFFKSYSGLKLRSFFNLEMSETEPMKSPGRWNEPRFFHRLMKMDDDDDDDDDEGDGDDDDDDEDDDETTSNNRRLTPI